MASFNKYQIFTKDLVNGKHALPAAGDVLKVALTNTAPNASTHVVLGDITEISAGNGYSAGGTDTQNDTSTSSGTASVTGVDVVFTASGGSIGGFRYVVLYNATQSSPNKPLVGWWDYGSSITLNDGDSFTVDFGSSMFTVA